MRWPWKRDVLPPPIIWETNYGEVKSTEIVFSLCYGCGLYVEFPAGTTISKYETRKRCAICNP